MRRYGCILAVYLSFAGLTACDWFRGTPEKRATDFIETLVVDPANDVRLRELSNAGMEYKPAELIDGMAARVALEYLRAKRKQGVDLKFKFEPVHRAEKRRLLVPVVARGGGVEELKERPVRINVEFDKDRNTGWRITRVWVSE